ncbi:MAG: large conductance mechanosensitive channel protein MscL [Cellulomonadaceae bacterium]|jgi:large conductance mechanosensitive channel|nr:large conductance mechanosensitive channel protein MscL [Cellulomonadaceae bacterium]
MFKGFKDFLLRGNVLDLAIGIVVGGAFTAVVQGLVNGILNPLIAAIFGQPDISHIGKFHLNGAEFSVGLVLNALLNFIIIAAALYFFVVLPVNKLMAMSKKPSPADEALSLEQSEVDLLTEIRDLLKTQNTAPTDVQA